jgi:protein-disulfide isomerase
MGHVLWPAGAPVIRFSAFVALSHAHAKVPRTTVKMKKVERQSMRRLGVLGIGGAVLGACNGHPDLEASARDALSPGTTTTHTSSFPPSPEPESVVEWDGGAISAAELDAETASELRNMEIQHRLQRYDVQKTTMDRLLIAALLRTAAERGRYPDIDALLRAEVDAKLQEPTESDVDAAYLTMARQFGSLPYAEARPLVRQQLTEHRQNEAYERYLAKLRADFGVRVRLPYPDLPRVEIPIDGDDPILGRPDAPITIVEFADYDCAFCAKVAPTLRRLVDESQGRVRLVFKDFPLSSNARSEQAALAAHCAGEQGRYWPMSQQLFDHVGELAMETIDQCARAAELDVVALHECMRSGRFVEQIQAGLRVGHDAGVSAAPSFFVNGVYLAGAQPYEQFKLLVELPITR